MTVKGFANSSDCQINSIQPPRRQQVVPKRPVGAKCPVLRSEKGLRAVPAHLTFPKTRVDSTNTVREDVPQIHLSAVSQVAYNSTRGSVWPRAGAESFAAARLLKGLIL